jgi:hypothetical protein
VTQGLTEENFYLVDKYGGQGRNRTADTGIFRPEQRFLAALFSTTYAHRPRAKLPQVDRSGHETTGVGHDLVTLPRAIKSLPHRTVCGLGNCLTGRCPATRTVASSKKISSVYCPGAITRLPEEGRQAALLQHLALDLGTLGETQILDNLDIYIRIFSPDAREVFEHF